MADSSRPEGNPRLDEEKLAHALVTRGLVTGEEVRACRAGGEGTLGAEGLLARLVAAGALTGAQGRRARQELEVLLGQQIPGYQLLQRLGQGAMGVVYKARQVSMNRLVAVKVLHPRLASDPAYLERFVREAHAAARLSHHNIVQAIDVGSAGPLHYFVMELVEGRTVREALGAGKVYGEGEALGVALQVARALGHAHGRGLVHRDVKPANVVVTEEGVAKLADLGLAQEAEDRALARSERGLVLGTPFYMAPEQVRGADVDGRADLYALGATLYHMVTGQPPFYSRNIEEVLRAHVHEALTPPDHVNAGLSSGLAEVVELLMAKRREDRYQSAEVLALDLEALLAGEAPRLARQRIEASALAGLADGAAEDDPGYEVVEDEGSGEVSDVAIGGPEQGWLWIALLGGLLGLSLLLNVVLLMRR